MIGGIVFFESGQDFNFPELHVLDGCSMWELFYHQQVHTFLNWLQLSLLYLGINKSIDFFDDIKLKLFVFTVFKLTEKIQADDAKSQWWIITIFIRIFYVHFHQHLKFLLHHWIHPLCQYCSSLRPRRVKFPLIGHFKTIFVLIMIHNKNKYSLI